MVNYTFKRSFFDIREMAFVCSNSPNVLNAKHCDIINLHSTDKEINKNLYAHTYKQYTLVSDLSLSKEEIFSSFTKTYQNEIRRCTRENIEYHYYWDFSKEVLDDFQIVYNNMFRDKNIKKVFNYNLIQEGLRNNQIVISKATSPDYANSVVYHAYLFDGSNADLIYSASPLLDESNTKEQINQIGRMNKGLHYSDLCILKDNGIKYLDWGGIGGKPEIVSGIGRFKAGFGGEMTFFINYTIATSLKGKLYLGLMKAKEKVLR